MGLEYFIDPEIRKRFGPVLKGITDLARFSPIGRENVTKNLYTSVANLLQGQSGIGPVITNIGKFASAGVKPFAEVFPPTKVSGKIAATPIKKVSKLADELITGYKTTTKTAMSKMDKDLIASMSDKDLIKYLKDNFDIDTNSGTILRTKKQLGIKPKSPGVPVSAMKLNSALDDMGEDLIGTMTNKQLVEYINKKYNLNVGLSNIQQRKLNTIKRTPDIQTKLKEVLSNIKNPENYSLVELMNKPSVKKFMEKFNMSKDTFKKYKSNLGITQKKLSKQENFLTKTGVEPLEFELFIKKYNPTTLQLKNNFPQLKNVAKTTIDNWRLKNNLSKIAEGTGYQILKGTNPRLQKQLDFIPQTSDVLPSNIPIKHKDTFSEIVKINTKEGPLDVLRTKLVQAHGIGEGGIKNSSKEIIKSKIAMIPDKFLKEEKLPQFFLTRSGNFLHRDIEDKLILALVKKYKMLGHEFVEGSWKQTKKTRLLNPKKRIKVKKLENEIAEYQEELNDLDAYTVFYNPIKDKLVTHGKPLSEIPGLSNLMQQVLKGTKKLRYGGLVGINQLTRRLGNF